MEIGVQRNSKEATKTRNEWNGESMQEKGKKQL